MIKRRQYYEALETGSIVSDIFEINVSTNLDNISSANPVVVDGQTYAVGDVVMTITTDESGTASTGSDVLSYGHLRSP